MPSWKSRASQLLGGGGRKASEPEALDPFQVVCRCGNRIGGTRQRNAQVAVCIRCSDRVLILPADPFPRAASARPAVVVPINADEDSDVAAQGRSGKSATLPENLTPAERAARRFEEVQRKKGSEPQRKATSGKGRAAVEVEPDFSEAARSRRPLFTPFRLIALGIVCSMLGLGYWGWNSRKADEAARTVGSNIDLADAAIAEGDLAQAAERYEEASKALKLLKRTDSEAARIQQAHRETAAAMNLLAISLEMIGEQAYEAQQGAAAGWEDSLQNRYKDQWVIIQARVEEFTGSDGRTRTRVRYPIAAGEHSVLIETDASACSTLLGDATKGEAIFAAQIDELRYLNVAGGESWVITLRPDSLILWSNWNTFEAVGLAGAGEESDAASKKILAQQSERLGVTP